MTKLDSNIACHKSLGGKKITLYKSLENNQISTLMPSIKHHQLSFKYSINLEPNRLESLKTSPVDNLTDFTPFSSIIS
jgi:hypothetical protein